MKGHYEYLITCMHWFLGYYKYLENIISVFLKSKTGGANETAVGGF